MNISQADRAYGLDLAGFAGSRSRLARASHGGDGQIEVRIYRTHLGAPRKVKEAAQVKAAWTPILEECRSRGRLIVDVPIDLQGLPVQGPEFLWQLTHRPIDYAFSALPPMASWIGYLFFSFQFLVGSDPPDLGTGLFETYPAASLEIMREGLGKRDQYKGQEATFFKDGWGPNPKEGLAGILNRLDIRASLEAKLNDDDVDALLCAVTGMNDAKAITPEELLKEVAKRISTGTGLGLEAAGRLASVPKGYRLLKKFPKGRVLVVLEPECSADELVARL